VDATSEVRARADVHAVAEDRVVIHAGGSVHDDVTTESRARVDYSASHDDRPVA
jgi:hypothetical protein